MPVVKRKPEDDATQSLEAERLKLHACRRIQTHFKAANQTINKSKQILSSTVHVMKLAKECIDQHKEVIKEKRGQLMRAHDPTQFDLVGAADHCQSEMTISMFMQEDHFREVSNQISEVIKLSETKEASIVGPWPPVPEVRPYRRPAVPEEWPQKYNPEDGM